MALELDDGGPSAGVNGDALLSTVVSYLASRTGSPSAAEDMMIRNMVATLASRVSSGALAQACAQLAGLAEMVMPGAAQPAFEPVAEMAWDEPSDDQPSLFDDLAPETIPALAPTDAAIGTGSKLSPAPEFWPEPTALTRAEPAPAWTIHAPAAQTPESLITASEAAIWQRAEEAAGASADTTVLSPAAEPEMPRPALLQEVSAAAAMPDPATCAPEHLTGLAALPEIDARTCNMIVARGHAPALAVLACNPAARFARSSLTTLAELAASDLSLREALCSRSDLPDATLDRLWPYLSLSAKAKVITAGCAVSRDEATVLCRDEANWVSPAETTLHTRSLGALVGEGRIEEALHLAAYLAGMPSALCFALVLGAYDRGALVVARLVNADEDMVDALMQLRARTGARRTADRCAPHHAYAKLDEAEARGILERLPGRATVAPPFASASSPRADMHLIAA